MDPSSFLGQIIKALLRYLRAYPLRQIALACVLYLPVITGLRFLFVVTGTEGTVLAFIQEWGIRVVAAGLAFLIALAWETARARSQAKRRRDLRQRLTAAKVAASEEKARTKEQAMRDLIAGLSKGDKFFLSVFVAQRRRHLDPDDFSQIEVGRQRLGRLESLGILDASFSGFYLKGGFFDFLLAEPALVGVDRAPTKRVQ